MTHLWELWSLADGLDMNDSEDRAIFRGKVERSFRNAKASAVFEQCRLRGIQHPHRNRAAALRALADGLIKRNANF